MKKILITQRLTFTDDRRVHPHVLRFILPGPYTPSLSNLSALLPHHHPAKLTYYGTTARALWSIHSLIRYHNFLKVYSLILYHPHHSHWLYFSALLDSVPLWVFGTEELYSQTLRQRKKWSSGKYIAIQNSEYRQIFTQSSVLWLLHWNKLFHILRTTSPIPPGSGDIWGK